MLTCGADSWRSSLSGSYREKEVPICSLECKRPSLLKGEEVILKLVGVCEC